MIELKNVTFAYKASKKNVLTDFSMHIEKGERVWLSGASGKGKTTILRLIMGLEKPKKGVVHIKENAKISVVFQEDRLIPFVTVKKNISLFSNDEKAEELLLKLGLHGCSDMTVDALSGGMKRRVAIARALAREFDVLILDEAMNGLDSDTAEKTAQVIKEICKDKTIIFVSHQEDQAKLLCEKQIEI